MNPYEVLNVPRDATEADIRKAYKALARVHHPDRAGGDDARMAEVNDAYAILGDAERRQRYDETGESRKPPSREDKAKEMLFQAMAAALQGCAPDADMVQAVKRGLNNGLFEGKAKVGELQNALCNLDKQRSKIEDDGFFSGLFDSRREVLTRNLASIEEQIEVVEIAIERLKTIRWTGEGPAPTQYYLPTWDLAR